MKILITGGAGFIGSAVVRSIINQNKHDVVNLDKLTYAGNLDSLSDVASSLRYTHEQVDICDRQVLDRVFQQCQPSAVMHQRLVMLTVPLMGQLILLIQILSVLLIFLRLRHYYEILKKIKQFRFIISTEKFMVI